MVSLIGYPFNQDIATGNDKTLSKACTPKVAKLKSKEKSYKILGNSGKS